MAGADAVVFTEVTKRYGAHVAVDAVSLRVPTGSIYGVIGPNGSGKTTALRLILGILRPDGGRVEVLGEAEARTANDRVGYLPEERGLYRKMTVQRQLAYFGRLKGLSGRSLNRAIDEGLERFGLGDWRHRKIEALSKGMVQKVQFLASVLVRPALVVLDEPFSGLDPVNHESLRDAVLELRRQGATVLLSTHDMATAERLCDAIFMIYRGRSVLDGTLAEIQAREGEDVVRLRCRGGRPPDLENWPGVVSVRDFGREQEVRFQGDPDGILQAALGSGCAVERFEIVSPSLHDIFVRIAGPEAREVPMGTANGEGEA